MPSVRLLAPLLLATTSLCGFAALPPRSTATTGTTERGEIRRIQSHFDSVLVELAAAGGSPALIERQRASRAALLVTLRAYRDRGVFPHNYDFPGRAVPYFVDRKTGTRCAVAHLLATTGGRDIVDRVARADNNVWVAQLAPDTAFAAWLSRNGLTLAEAARIQIPYMPIDPMPSPTATPEQRTRSATYAIVAPLAAGSAIMASVINAHGNADGHSRAANLVGLVSGIATTGIGVASAGRSGVPLAASAAGAALGGLSIVLSTRAMHRHEVLASEAVERSRRNAEASVAPFVNTGRGAKAGAGVAVSVRF
jgi:hypothetical protein